MKTLTNIRSLMACLALAAAVPAVVDAQVRPNFYGQPMMDRTLQVEPAGIEPALARVQQLAQAGLDWQTQADRAGMTVEDGRVLVEMQGADAIGGLVNRNYELVFSGDSRRQRAWIDPRNLANFAKDARVSAYRAPVANSYGGEANEAEAAMRADMYAASGLMGQGVHVAVIDLGFGGLDNSAETGKTLRIQDGLDADAEVHGTAMIEAIRDIAPDATITAIRLDANFDIIGATRAAISSGADIIVCPLSWFGLPGQGQACDAAAMASAQNIMWINAAGNFGDRRYFEGEGLPTVAFGADNYVDFGGDPYQFINGMSGGDKFSVHFASLGGLQLELFRWDGLSADFVLVGQGDVKSAEQVVAHEYVADMYYFPMVRQLAPGVVPSFRMFAVGGDLHFSGAAGSIANPAQGGVTSVGAVDAGDYGERSAPEPYSSLGGGIFNLTMELCGPTGSTTGTYGPQGFSGTSAASANIAGLMALQLADRALASDPLGMLVRVDIGGADIAFALVDAFEPDNDPTIASDLGNATVQAEEHMISPSADQDWYSFTLDRDSSVSIVAKGCRLEIYSHGLMAAGDDQVTKALMVAGSYSIRVTSTVIRNYSMRLAIFEGAPERVETMSPASGAVTTAEMVKLVWAPVEGLGSIRYLVEVSEDNGFRILMQEQKTYGNSISVSCARDTVIYWRVTAINEFGAAPASDTHSLVFAPILISAAGSIPSQTIVSATLSAIQPEGNQDNATGCAGASSAGAFTILVTMIGAMAIVRIRRKHA